MLLRSGRSDPLGPLRGASPFFKPFMIYVTAVQHFYAVTFPPGRAWEVTVSIFERPYVLATEEFGGAAARRLNAVPREEPTRPESNVKRDN